MSGDRRSVVLVERYWADNICFFGWYLGGLFEMKNLGVNAYLD